MLRRLPLWYFQKCREEAINFDQRLCQLKVLCYIYGEAFNSIIDKKVLSFDNKMFIIWLDLTQCRSSKC